jgi:hypothetical protein
VAIKVLPERLQESPEQRRRFEHGGAEGKLHAVAGTSSSGIGFAVARSRETYLRSFDVMSTVIMKPFVPRVSNAFVPTR